MRSRKKNLSPVMVALIVIGEVPPSTMEIAMCMVERSPGLPESVAAGDRCVPLTAELPNQLQTCLNRVELLAALDLPSRVRSGDEEVFLMELPWHSGPGRGPMMKPDLVGSSASASGYRRP
jgi:hypothetical protein